jgi:hypothetical protein
MLRCYKEKIVWYEMENKYYFNSKEKILSYAIKKEESIVCVYIYINKKIIRDRKTERK